ncbi:GTP-binding protein LepA [Roseobacter sp. SK209-2-6]|nr:GTP-binding protein LepA [Roseobacter sp. SK209-2-6]
MDGDMIWILAVVKRACKLQSSYLNVED